MGIKTSTLRRAATVGTGLALSAVLTACSGGTGAEAPQEGDKNQSPSTDTSQASGGLGIANPKDAAAVDVCSLLPDDAAKKLGVKPDGERQSNTLDPSLPDSCVWETPDPRSGAPSVSLTAFDDRSIKVYYKNSSTYVDFKKMTIAGYPTVRANKNDPMVGGSCALFMATKNNQVVGVTSRVPTEKVGKADPCELGKKALKLSVSTWPAAK